MATRRFDEILAGRDTIDREVRSCVTERAGALGAEIGGKDGILPEDVRELLNKVVGRSGRGRPDPAPQETAATRSLLNAARLMDDNPLLLRLKELEALEKLVEKVGRIDLHTGAGICFKVGLSDGRRRRCPWASPPHAGNSSLRFQISPTVALPPLDYLRHFRQTRVPLKKASATD